MATVAGSVFAYGQVQAQDDSPAGDWSVAIARTDVPVDIASSFSYVGRWRLSIDADGTYDAERLDVGTTLVSGTWTTEGDQITFTDEGGILSCANAAAMPIVNDDLDSGTYTWTRSGKTLTLTRSDDACPGRVILLSTFAFSTYIACSTPPMSMAELLGSPVPETFDVTATIAASPIAVSDTATVGTPESGSVSFASEIDTLLGQMTACWASREPERWLPLLSNEFRDALIQSDPNFLETLNHFDVLTHRLGAQWRYHYRSAQPNLHHGEIDLRHRRGLPNLRLHLRRWSMEMEWLGFGSES